MITFAELKNKSSKLYPAILLEKYSSYRKRRIARNIMFWLLILLFVAMVIGPELPLRLGEVSMFFRDYQTNIRSAFVLALLVWVSLYLIRAFYFSHYFRKSEIDFEVAKLIMDSDEETDITKTFLESDVGQYTMIRLGIGSDQIKNFVRNRKNIIPADKFDIERTYTKEYIGVKDYGKSLLRQDPDFASFLSQYKVDSDTFVEALEWVDDLEWKIRASQKWWDRSHLARIKGLGRNWAFGKVYLLEKYGHSIMSDNSYLNLGDRWRVYEKDARKIESILVKKRDANVALVSPTTSIGLNIMASLGKMILNGKILFEIEDRRIYVLDTVAIMESVNDSNNLEILIRDILFQTNRAGNVILVIPNLPAFAEHANSLGVDVMNLLSDFLSSARMQIVAISDRHSYHQVLEPNMGLMQSFEKILVEDIDKNSAIKILQDEVNRVEVSNDVFFTFQCIRAISEGAERYFVGSTYSDKILDLLDEVVVEAKTSGRKIITEEDAHKVISIKTGVPQGQITQKEKTILANLEEILHQRVIGQDLAIDSISNSMRRARSGITDPNRPMGSFLFIGPTGVGKTETVKALNEVFFKNEEKIIRLDMSEYNSDDAIEKLIGSYSNKSSGILASKIRDQQYGVLLLDEFEKTSDKVKDIFLQILDEGQFSDSQGNKINCRNLIIIATSNAGSQLIFDVTRSGGNLAEKKDDIIKQIINERIFKPELLNRFDGTILFHSLEKEHLQKIAKLMLEKLNERIAKNGIRIKTKDDIVDYLVEIGSDPKFGAREMNRKIKDEIESLIADKIISGEVESGDIIEFNLEDGVLGLTSKKIV
ncbi:ATP-dependent Clp protease ATP-binding subunit [Candidatus Parcubacteria bacterium]|nr:ATP-dependent Clp protease ATP-binding subunit [Candidatus Parcubacteria bacterium]